jgi:hypothetical protein
MIAIVSLFGVLFITPVAPAFIMMNGGVGSSPILEANSNTPIIPSGPADWVSVSLESEYFYNDTAVISWSGESRTVAQSPFNPLLNWTQSGSIEGGIWDGNPGNATITAIPLDNETTAAEAADFLNFTSTNYVPLDSWPSFSNFNFTEYENETLWTFNDPITSHEIFLNLTFYQVDNATGYLINGFNATGIATALLEYHIYMEWSDTDARLTFTYRIPGATELDGDSYIFSLGRAMGRTNPLILNGSGTFTVDGPSSRMITNGLPVEIFENDPFPYFPIGIEEYDFNLNPQDFEYTVWFQESISALVVSREINTHLLRRGDTLFVEITVINTGDVPFSQVIINDLQAIEDGIFQLAGGAASDTVFNLQAGENVTLEYAVMAIVEGSYEYPAVRVGGVDFFSDQYTFASTTESLIITSGLLPSETLLIQIGVILIIIAIISLILYRFRRRIF